MKGGRYAPLLALAAAVVALQLSLSAVGLHYWYAQLTIAAYYSVVVLGLCLLMGYAGQVSLGHAAFFAIGGYTAATISTIDLRPHETDAWVGALHGLGVLLERQDLYGRSLLYLSPWVSLVAAVLVTAVVAVLIGIPVIRLRGHYLAMATLGFGTIVYRILLGTRIFGEADGITRVPPFPILGDLRVDGGSPALRVQNYYLAWALVLVASAVSINLVRSRVGRALRSIHENEEAAGALGIDPGRHKLAVFVLSALLASVAGVFLTHYSGGIGPGEAGVMKSVRYVAIVAVGGMAHIWGTLVMAVVLSFLSLRGAFGTLDDAVFGCILIAIMIFAPRGIFQLAEIRRPAWLGGRRTADG